MLDAKIETALNHQINQEMAAAYNYLAMAAHFEAMNLKGFAQWMYVQRREELEHAERLWTYVLDRGGRLDLAAVNKPKAEFNTVREVFETALKQERQNTKSIHELYELAFELKDYPTQSHLKWFIDEQVEEEKIMEETLGMIDLAGDDKGALLVLNQQFGQRTGDENPAS